MKAQTAVLVYDAARVVITAALLTALYLALLQA